MTFELTFKAFAVWLGILTLAIVNGALREAMLVPVLGKPSGLILNGALLSCLILAVSYFVLPWFGRAAVTSYLLIGIGWLCLTLVFEFTFGRIVQSKSWPQLLEAYVFKDGNIWPFVLLVTLVAPYVAAQVRGWA